MSSPISNAFEFNTLHQDTTIWVNDSNELTSIVIPSANKQFVVYNRKAATSIDKAQVLYAESEDFVGIKNFYLRRAGGYLTVNVGPSDDSSSTVAVVAVDGEKTDSGSGYWEKINGSRLA